MLICNSDFLNLISCELDITSILLSNTTILAYEVELPPSGNIIVLHLLDDEDFKIPYVNDTTPNYPAFCQRPTQA